MPDDPDPSGACRCAGHAAPGPHDPGPGEVHVRILPGAYFDEHGRIRFEARWRDDDGDTVRIRGQHFDTDLATFTDRHVGTGHGVTIVNPDHPALAVRPDA